MVKPGGMIVLSIPPLQLPGGVHPPHPPQDLRPCSLPYGMRDHRTTVTWCVTSGCSVHCAPPPPSRHSTLFPTRSHSRRWFHPCPPPAGGAAGRRCNWRRQTRPATRRPWRSTWRGRRRYSAETRVYLWTHSCIISLLVTKLTGTIYLATGRCFFFL